MHSELSPNHYLSPDIFEAEKKSLFQRLWVFACFRSSVAEDRAFVTREIGGVHLFLKNHEGEIRAFENRCPHRLMPIHDQEFGQSKSVCPYHGWVFDDHGKVKTIPKEEDLYGYCPSAREALGLKKFAVSVVGNLVFVNLDANPIALTEQFSSELLDELKEISEHFGQLAVHANIDTAYNWKLNFENVLDHNHIPYVHPKTFQPLVRSQADVNHADERLQVPDVSITSDLCAQSFHAKTSMHIQPWPWHSMVERYGQEGVYHNFFLFPNINFISVGGLIFLMQQFCPVSPSKTQVRFTLSIAKEKKRLPALPAILRGHLKGEIDVLMEDVVHLENLQARLTEGAPRAFHGRYEHRLISFAQAYLALLEKGE